MSYNPKQAGPRMKILKRWLDRAHMGNNEPTKSLSIAVAGDIVGHPVRSTLALRAWMLMRFEQRGFKDKRESRKSWFRREHAKLSADVRALAVPGGGTGSPKVDELIMAWQPSVLSPLKDKEKQH